ncbi:hypothetical protein D104_07565 [Marinomonas profundimaris]|uniref:Uncharacterized protein n=1 Tax=Marinomonas profundimaris TaxID=1208321 RepID=W1RYN8_9GAMM|nr:hypothetical protein D104_07565 [Marinomonas profundimaris]
MLAELKLSFPLPYQSDVIEVFQKPDKTKAPEGASVAPEFIYMNSFAAALFKAIQSNRFIERLTYGRYAYVRFQ